LSVAGDIIDPDADSGAKLRAVGRAGRFYAGWLPTLVVGSGQRPGAYGEFGPLAPHLRFVERAARKLARSVFYAAGRWQGKLEYKQGFLGRMVDIGAELFAMSAVCVRAERDDTVSARELADAFCRQSRVRVEELFDRLWRNTDAVDGKVARKLLAGDYTWLEEGVIDPSIPGPWIAEAPPGPSEVPSVHRRIP
jgi:hypothetical protein